MAQDKRLIPELPATLPLPCAESRDSRNETVGAAVYPGAAHQLPLAPPAGPGPSRTAFWEGRGLAQGHVAEVEAEPLWNPGISDPEPSPLAHTALPKTWLFAR